MFRLTATVMDLRTNELRGEYRREVAEVRAELTEVQDRLARLEAYIPEDHSTIPIRHASYGPWPHHRAIDPRLETAIERLRDGIEPVVVADDLDLTESELMAELAHYAGQTC